MPRKPILGVRYAPKMGNSCKANSPAVHCQNGGRKGVPRGKALASFLSPFLCDEAKKWHRCQPRAREAGRASGDARDKSKRKTPNPARRKIRGKRTQLQSSFFIRIISMFLPNIQNHLVSLGRQSAEGHVGRRKEISTARLAVL